MEWITTMLMLRFTDELCACVKKGKSMCGIRVGTFLNRRGIAVIPCVNPDGVEIQLHGAGSAGEYRELVERVSMGDTGHWQANAAGVDINHNFSAGWEDLKRLELESGISSPSPTRYGGEAPESEPETRTIASYCRTGSISHALAFHSQGEEIYWSYGDYKEPEALRMARLMSHSSGYKLGEAEGLACGGGFKDWFCQSMKKPGFTVEVGKGKNPLPITELESIYNKIEEMLTLSILL